MTTLIKINSKADIPQNYVGTPIEDLLLYHNLNMLHRPYESAELLIGMCMDHRKSLKIPSNFSYVIRTGGANLRYSEFKISYAIAVGGIKYIAIMGHTQCGMVNLNERRELFISGLIERAGWSEKDAKDHFEKDALTFEIGDAADFTLSQADHLRKRYPRIKIAPLLYRVEDNLIYCLAHSE